MGDSFRVHGFDPYRTWLYIWMQHIKVIIPKVSSSWTCLNRVIFGLLWNVNLITFDFLFRANSTKPRSHGTERFCDVVQSTEWQLLALQLWLRQQTTILRVKKSLNSRRHSSSSTLWICPSAIACQQWLFITRMAFSSYKCSSWLFDRTSYEPRQRQIQEDPHMDRDD